MREGLRADSGVWGRERERPGSAELSEGGAGPGRGLGERGE